MPILSELATMTEVAQGTSLARFGHGELLIMAREDAEHQKWDAQLDDELWGIFTSSPCLTAIPPFDPPGWDGFLEDYEEIFENKGWYGSSFVSRHDWAQWTEEYRKVLEVILASSERPLVIAPENYLFAEASNHIVCASRNAYDDIDNLQMGAVTGFAKLVILSCGPTATVLDDRLARKGIWAVDLGNFGKFL